MRYEKACRGAPLGVVAGVVAAMIGLLPCGAHPETPEIPPPQSSAAGEDLDRVQPLLEPAIEDGPRDLTVTHQIRVTGSVWRPVDSGATYSSSPGGGCVYATANPLTMFNTFLTLPHGATLIGARFYFNDTSGSDSFILISELDYEGYPNSEWRLDSWGDTGSGYVTFDDINHVIDYTQYSYVVNWRPVLAANNMKACGFRIWYTMP